SPPGVLASLVNQKQFITNSLAGFHNEFGGVRKFLYSFAIRQGGRVAATEDERTEGDINLIDHPGAQQAFIEFPATLAEQPFYAPVLAQPAACRHEVDFLLPADFDLICDRLKLS